MKQLSKLLLLVSVVFFYSCSDDNETKAPVADFTATVSGDAPNATVTITNNSTDAGTYVWTFGEGSNLETSTDEAPSITVDKTGSLEISLVASNGSEQDQMTQTVTISGNNAIVTYTDLEFGLDAGDDTYGRLFSFEDGKIYKDSEITEANGASIGLAFGSMGNTMYYFESPSAEDYNVPNATVTQVINYESEPTFNATQFDAMADDSELADLTIDGTEDSFGNSSIPNVVLFQLADGRKGAIKTKAVNSDRLLVDIKVQKY
ncbi:PKD domain-containing protein [Fulvivirga ligni]|uniref:PKD domain-containing protein n=1 Tax=Fulvivirga ligni TaxID=2904246 RepID=UPI001F24C0FB|nr:PKD domain-containing protein [Fulvivirga ligni]UII23650.1 PKD domain-containing protein [Fulvivirga ligni]